IDTAIDGRPIYDSIAGRRQDFLLTNVSGDSGSSTVFSMGISKSFESGLDVQFGYAYTQAEDVNPMTSSVAYSNYTTLATDNPNNPDVATSNYEIPHRFTLRLYYEKAFIGNFKTKFSLIGSANEGRPYSYAFSDNTIFGEFVFTDRQLLYVPTGITDPNVIFGDGFDAEAFFAFVDDENLDRGRIMKRNELNSDWWTKFDVRVEQEFPGFSQEHSASAFFVIENLGNLINDDWGVLYETDFPRIQSAVNATIDEDSGRYVFNSFEDPATQTRVRDASLWKARIGIRYDF
ncbi:MAG: TonB-dependent receptor, partial [Spongiibacteraceae bacterium]|nr:TonB-dependent receptor [Spongiibacteraceae bacterium]